MTPPVKGPKGDRGEQGIQGEQGPAGESKVNATADAAVRTLVKAAHWHRFWISLLVVMFVVLSLVVSRLAYLSVTHPVSNQLKAEVAENQKTIAELKQYVREYSQHSCAALEDLTATAVPKPADPKANPSREQNYKFYEAIKHWESLDGC